MIFQKSQPDETGPDRVPLLCLGEATRKYEYATPPSPHEKRMHNKFTKKVAAFRKLSNCNGPYGAV
jgi:hypothetical protein